MKRATLCTALLLTVVVSASAAPPGFLTDFGEARQQAQSTGKLIFAYFHLDG